MPTRPDDVSATPDQTLQAVIAEALCMNDEGHDVHLTHHDVAERIAEAIREHLLAGLSIGSTYAGDPAVWVEGGRQCALLRRESYATARLFDTLARLLAGREAPILDANGDPVRDFNSATDSRISNAEVRAFYAGRVPAPDCPHYIARSEAAAGFRKCERC